jgi:hypothetical protein
MWKKIKEYFYELDVSERMFIPLLVLNVLFPTELATQLNSLFTCGILLGLLSNKTILGIKIENKIDNVLPENDTKT